MAAGDSALAFVGMKPLDIFSSTLGLFPAVLEATKCDISDEMLGHFPAVSDSKSNYF